MKPSQGTKPARITGNFGDGETWHEERNRPHTAFLILHTGPPLGQPILRDAGSKDKCFSLCTDQRTYCDRVEITAQTPASQPNKFAPCLSATKFPNSLGWAVRRAMPIGDSLSGVLI
jgi:hypothetical protein